jgi:hypothetical protein
LQNPNGQSAQDVDQGDEDAGDGITPDELAGTVHRAVEVGFSRDLFASGPGLIFGNEPGVEVGVDAHLLTGHRVQCESRGDLGHPTSALGDNNELDNDDDQEDDHPEDVVAFDDKVAKGVDHITGIRFSQDQSGGGDVEREPEEREDQQQSRKNGQLKWLGDIDGHQDDDKAERDVERQQHVDQPRRHRNHHHRDHSDHGKGEKDVRVLGDSVKDQVHTSLQKAQPKAS